jgi:hypothetical protein
VELAKALVYIGKGILAHLVETRGRRKEYGEKQSWKNE